MTSPGLRHRVAIFVDGRERESDDLVFVRTNATLNRPASAEFRVQKDRWSYDGGPYWAADIAKGLEVKVLGADGRNLTTVFKGEITGLSTDVEAGGSVVQTVHGLDLSHRLMRRRTFRTFANTSLADAIKKVIGPGGLTAKVSDLPPDQIPVLTQTTSDLEFITDLVRRYGCDWYCDGTSFVIAKPEEGRPITIEADDIGQLSVDYDASLVAFTEEVHEWDPAEQKSIVEKAKAGKGWASKAASNFPKPEPATATQPALTAKEAKAIAAARQTLGYERGRVATLTTSLRTDIELGKATIKVKAVGFAKPGEPEQFGLTGIEHGFDGSEEWTRLDLGSRDRQRFSDQVLATPEFDDWASAGPVVGIVTNVDDPDKLGRVKVKFPQLGDEVESDWARIVAPRAGKETGLYTSPAVDDEVIVLFEVGDLRRPLVLGGVWSAKIKPPAAGDAPTETVAITSPDGLQSIKLVSDRNKATPEVQIAFEEKESKKTTAKLHFYDENARLEIEKGAIEVTVADKKASIKIDDKGNITIKTPESVTVEATKDLTLKGKNVTVEATANAEIKGKSAKLNGSSSAEVSSGGSTAVKGSKVAIN